MDQVSNEELKSEREAFEAWHLETFKHPASEFESDPLTAKYFQDPVWMAYQAATRRSSPPIPKGWVSAKDRLHPEKPGLSPYEHVACLIVRNGEIMLRQWNCEHLVWDDEDGDDFYCEAQDITHWMEIPPSPYQQTKIETPGANTDSAPNSLHAGLGAD